MIRPAELTSIAAQFASVLHTNHVPTPSELPSLLKYTSHLTSIQDGLQTELESLQARLSDLQEQHEMLTEAVAPYHSFSSAFRRFPPELLQVIFVHCLPETRNPVMHASEAPLVLGRVCSRWRRIVESTPELWACLHVVPPNVSIAGNGVEVIDVGSDSDGEGGVGEEEGIGNRPLTQEAHTRAVNAARFAKKREIVSWWLERSGTCPLSLSFVWFGSEGDNEMRLCASLLDLLLPLSRRWGRMEFQVPVRMFEFTGGSGKGNFAGLKPEDVPLLRHFSLTDNRSTFSETEELSAWPSCLAFLNSGSRNAALGAVPRLYELSLTFFSGGIRLPTISCSSLRGLYLESNIGFFWSSEDPEMWNTLAQCVVLESLTLKFPLSSNDPLPAHPFSTGNEGNGGVSGQRRRNRNQRRITTLPMLERLCLDGDQSLGGAFHITRAMAGMRCPKLRVLEVFGRTTGTPLIGEDDDSEGGAGDTDLLKMNETDWPLPVTSHEPMHGIMHLLIQSERPPLQRLTLESVNLDLVGREMLKCLRLVEDTLEELVIRDYAWRVGSGSGSGSDRGREGKLTTEDMLLLDLIAKGEQEIQQWSSPSSSSSIAVAESPAVRPHTLCPNLTTLDASLSNAASQTLFCDFIESRYPHPPKGVKKLKRVSCTFTAKENAGVKKRVERLKKLGKARADGSVGDDEEESDKEEEEEDLADGEGEGEGTGEPLDIQLTFHMPMPDEIIPSAWTGIEGI